MNDELLQRWYQTGAVEDGHRYIAALQREGWLRVPSATQLFAELLGALPSGCSVEHQRLDDGACGGGVVFETLQLCDAAGEPRASLVRAWLDEVPYLVLPQRWTRSPVRMLRVRVTTCPDAGQIGPEAHAQWLARVRASYGLAEDGAPIRATRPTGTAALELDLGELMVARWRERLPALCDQPDALRRLLALLDVLISFRGERGGSVDTALVTFDTELLPDRALETLDPGALGGPPGLRRADDADDTLEVVGWSYKLDEVAGEQVARLALRIEPHRWWFEKRVIADHRSPISGGR